MQFNPQRSGEMKVNVAQKFTEKTHEGAQASRTTPEQQLRRSVAACLLWEDSFYESGEDIAKRIASLIPLCPPECRPATPAPPGPGAPPPSFWRAHQPHTPADPPRPSPALAPPHRRAR